MTDEKVKLGALTGISQHSKNIFVDDLHLKVAFYNIHFDNKT